MAASYHQRQIDTKKLQELVKENPRLGEAEEPPQFIPEYLRKIGILYQGAPVGQGYIKLLYQDFIVEEITEKGEIASIDPGELIRSEWDAPTPEDPSKKLRLETELVKQGFSTFEALERLGEALNIGPEKLTIGGLKDGKALTSQRVCLNGVSKEQLREVEIPNMFFKNAHYRVGMRNSGELYGNRFTILIRTGQVDIPALRRQLDEIKQNGFINFFSLQRFGSRLNSHVIGRQILTGRYDQALQEFLTGQSPHESRFLQDIREQASVRWGDWEAVANVFSQFPYFFQNELKAAEAMIQNPGDPTAGLAGAGDQTKMCVQAIGSYYFNQILSKQVEKNAVDQTIPILTPDTVSWYQAQLPHEDLSPLRWNHQRLRFLGMPRTNQVKTRANITIHSATPVDEGIIFHFDLGKGSYATTFLADLFQLYQGRPVPEWVKQDLVDTRATIGYQPVANTLEAFLPSRPGG